MAISPVRSRMDIAIVFAATRTIVNNTTVEILTTSSRTFPYIDTKLRKNAFSDSVFVGAVLFANILSIASMTAGMSSADFALTDKVPIWLELFPSSLK